MKNRLKWTNGQSTGTFPRGQLPAWVPENAAVDRRSTANCQRTRQRPNGPSSVYSVRAHDLFPECLSNCYLTALLYGHPERAASGSRDWWDCRAATSSVRLG